MIDTKDQGIALLRVTLGGFVLVHGLIKLFVFTPAGTAGYFASLGLPAFLAYLTIAAEVLGGLGLIAGVMTRIASLGLAVIMIGTIVTVHGAKGFLFSAPGGGWEYPALWALALVAQALMGPGAYALRLGRARAVTA